MPYFKYKLDFHRAYPRFDGSYEFQDSITRAFTQQLDRGFEVVARVMALQDNIDALSSRILGSFRLENELRISALVCLLKESWHLYDFAKNTMRALYAKTSEPDALLALHERFDKQHARLRRFYYACSNLRYLTALYNVPKLTPVCLDCSPAPEPDLLQSRNRLS